MDSFDRLADQAHPAPPKRGKPRPEPAPQPKEQAGMPMSQFAAALQKRVSGQWCVFDHPKHGRVAAKCLKADFSGYAQPGNIPDFDVLLLGRSKTQRNEITVSMVESHAMFFDTEGEALASLPTKTTT